MIRSYFTTQCACARGLFGTRQGGLATYSRIIFLFSAEQRVQEKRNDDPLYLQVGHVFSMPFHGVAGRLDALQKRQDAAVHFPELFFVSSLLLRQTSG